MKKLILISSLLAAGTMMTNAATLIAQWNDFSDLTSDLGSTSLTVSTGLSGASIDTATSTLSVASVSTYANRRASVDLSSAGITGTTGFTLVMTISDWSAGPNAIVADMYFDPGSDTITNSGDYGIGFGRGNTYNTKWAINNLGSVTEGVASTAAYATSGLVVLTYDSDGNGALYVDGASVSTSTERSDLSSYTFSKLTLGGMAHAAAGASSYTLEKMAIYSGVLDTSAITAGNVYAVPEPSMFGLLAGTLALGLAGARRRRAK